MGHAERDDVVSMGGVGYTCSQVHDIQDPEEEKRGDSVSASDRTMSCD